MAVGVEGAPARQHLVEEGPEREHVAARVHVLALKLLRRHVRDRSEQQPCAGDRVLRLQRRLRRRLGPRGVQLGQAEVEDLRARLREDHVARLQVAVDDAALVRGVEGLGDLRRDVERLRERQRTFQQPVGE